VTVQHPTQTIPTDLLSKVSRLIFKDQPQLAQTNEVLSVLRHFDAFHDGPPQSYLGYRYRLRVALDGPRDRHLSPVDVLRFISMTVNDGRTLRQHLNKKYGPFEEPGFDGVSPYAEEGSELLIELKSMVRQRFGFDTTEAEATALDHLENMIALLLSSETAKAFEIHDKFVTLILDTLNDAGGPTERVTATHELLDPLMRDRAHNPTRAREKAQAQFIDLREGRYDFLLPYEDRLEHTVLRLDQDRINFEVLPPGTDLEAYARRKHRRTSPHSGPRLAPEKLQVLQDLEHYFGPGQCQLLRGIPSQRNLTGPFHTNINGSYLVLVIRHADRSGRHIGDDAIAISPLEGQATFYVRHDAVDRPWKEIFSYPKRDATAMGARRLHLTGPAGWDPATALRERLIALARCSPHQFREGTPVPVPGSHKYTVT